MVRRHGDTQCENGSNEANRPARGRYVDVRCDAMERIARAGNVGSRPGAAAVSVAAAWARVCNSRGGERVGADYRARDCTPWARGVLRGGCSGGCNLACQSAVCHVNVP